MPQLTELSTASVPLGREGTDPWRQTTVNTPQGTVRFVKRNWWRGWNPEPVEPPPATGTTGGGTDHYTGLSEDHKRAIWQGVLGRMSQEARKRLRKGGH